jgi:hypothetical protein
MGGMFHHRSTNVVTQAPFPKIIAATFSTAFDAMALVTWLYVLSVTFVELCPRRSATTFGCSPALSARVRHSFAVETLTGWYRDGEEVEPRLPMLSTYLGHLEPALTYWYLSATPELLALAARRLENDGEVAP